MVASQHDGDRARLGGDADGVLQVVEWKLLLDARHLDISGVEHPQVLQRVDAQREVRARRVVWQVVGGPDHLGAEPCAAPI